MKPNPEGDGPPRPQAPPRSVFAGRGMFTVERPQDAAGLGCYVLRQAQFQVWTLGDGDYVYVYQDEGPSDRAVALAANPIQERALVTNLWADDWPAGWTCMPECYWNADGGVPGPGRSVQNMVFRARQVIGPAWGSVPVIPVIGCYDASGENPGVGVRLTVPDYLPALHEVMRENPCVVGWAVWRVETLAVEDVRALGGR